MTFSQNLSATSQRRFSRMERKHTKSACFLAPRMVLQFVAISKTRLSSLQKNRPSLKQCNGSMSISRREYGTMPATGLNAQPPRSNIDCFDVLVKIPRSFEYVRQSIVGLHSPASDSCGSERSMKAFSSTGPTMSTRLAAIHEMTAGLLMKASPLLPLLRSMTSISFRVATISSGRMKVASLISLTVILFFAGTLTMYLAMVAAQNWTYALRPNSESAVNNEMSVSVV
jgi:hypothetical protein